MLLQIVSFLNDLMSDFGSVVMVAVAFWLAYLLLPPLFARRHQDTGADGSLARRFGLPPSRRER